MGFPCAKMGRPCSWTGLSFLFGVEDWQDEMDAEKTTKGELHKRAVKGLINLPYVDGALRVHEIGGKPGLIIVGQ